MEIRSEMDIDELGNIDEVSASPLEEHPVLQNYRMPKSTPVVKPADDENAASGPESVEQTNSISNMQNTFGSLIVEEKKCSSIRNETSFLESSDYPMAVAKTEPGYHNPEVDNVLTETPRLLRGLSGSPRTPLPTKRTPKLTTPGSRCLDLTYQQLETIRDYVTAEPPYDRFKLLSDLTSFSHLKNLTYLDMSYNSLTDLSGNLAGITLGLCHLTSLKELKAGDNSITDVSPLFHLPLLNSVDLQNNCISELDITPGAWETVQRLNLSGNHLGRLETLGYLASLEELIADDNELTVFSPLQLLPRLKTVSLNDNSLSQLTCVTMPALLSLSIERNCLTAIHDIPRSLVSLSAEAQSSGELSITGFEGTHLRLGGNPGIRWDRSWCSNLESLDVSDCNIAELAQCIGTSNRLRHLCLERNQISDISSLRPLKTLQVLNMANNCLSNITVVGKTLRKLTSLTTLDLRENCFINDRASLAQKEVASIVLKTCILMSCKSLKMLDLEAVDAQERDDATRKLLALKRIAALHQRKKQAEAFHGWKPQLQPLTDMSVDEEIVLEIM
ncbi:hypothetical protein HDU91_000286 [Kappamyces sp. JEL0680]|nr:hypothetical protein HDU91_000286 [Kappamyces sp. JEL0680]